MSAEWKELMGRKKKKNQGKVDLQGKANQRLEKGQPWREGEIKDWAQQIQVF